MDNLEKRPQKPIKARIGPYIFRGRDGVFKEIKDLDCSSRSESPSKRPFWPIFGLFPGPIWAFSRGVRPLAPMHNARNLAKRRAKDYFNYNSET